MQVPEKQAWPAPHTLPQTPQLTLSDCRFAQYEPASGSHIVCDVGQLLLQRPSTQATPAPQTLPQAPQFAGSICVLVQASGQLVCAAGHWDTEPSNLAS